MLSLFSLTAFAQIKITGTASDAETGEPLSFITIQIKGTTAGTTSDMDGNYSIEVPNRDAILVYSYIGYRSREIEYEGQLFLNVQLEDDTRILDEVVVTALGIEKKGSSLPYVTQLISGEELARTKDFNFMSTLSG